MNVAADSCAAKGLGVSERSRYELIVKIGLTLILVLMAYKSLSATVAAIVVRGDPQLAHKFAPNDGRYFADLAELWILSGQNDDASQTQELAREALRRDPTAVEALITLGMLAELQGRTNLSRSYFLKSLDLSRREFRAHIWSIEEGVQQGDIDLVLARYDVALRVFRNAPDLLFPVLSQAIGQPLIRGKLLSLLQKRPLWEGQFVQYLADKADDPIAAVEFFKEGRRTGLPVTEAHRAALVNVLFARGSVTDAWEFYATFRPSVSRQAVRNANFSDWIINPSVFDWNAISGNGQSSVIHRGADSGSADFLVSAGSGGTVLQQVQLLSPGQYILRVNAQDLKLASRDTLTFLVVCPDGTAHRLPIAPGKGATTRFQTSFAIQPNCPYQILRLEAQSIEGIKPIEGRITHVSLAPS